jgi:hypothetical protein
MPSKLTPNDFNVLEKLKDPESAAAPILVDSSLPKDPNLTDLDAYTAAVTGERKIMMDVLALQKKEAENLIKDTVHPTAEQRAVRTTILAKWLIIILRLDKLVEQFPDYASARNNRVQALRMVYGDGMLVKLWAEKEETLPGGGKVKKSCTVSDGLPSVDTYNMTQDTTLRQVAKKVLDDLTQGILLLTPRTAFAPVSPQQASHLASLYMQRAQLYRVAAQKLSKNGTSPETVTSDIGAEIRNAELKAEFRVTMAQKEAPWTVLDFEEHASRDFMMAGRYGNDIGKRLAVAMNPTAKLCGEMVKEAMRKEYENGDASEYAV